MGFDRNDPRQLAAALRRRRRSGGGAVADDGNATLVADLGGDAGVLAFYDVRNNVTATGGVVDAWDDTRGASGFGPQLVGVTTGRPAYDGSLITGDGVDDVLQSADIAAFDLSGVRAVVFIGVIPDYTGGAPWGDTAMLTNTALTRTLSIAELNGGNIGVSNGASLGGSSIIGSATRRVAIASKLAASDWQAHVLDVASAVFTFGTVAAGDNRLCVFARPAGTFATASAARAVLVLNFRPDATQRGILRDYGVAQHSTVTAA